MKRICFLMVGCVSVFAGPVSHAEAPVAAHDQLQASGADDAAVASDVHADAIGQFHLIRVANTQLCLQPAGGSSADSVGIEMQPCNPGAPVQNWFLSTTSSGTSIVNNASGKCIYLNTNTVSNGAPIVQGGCLVSNKPVVSSNATWKFVNTTAGETSIMSRVHFTDTGFCIDVPGGNPFAGAQVQLWSCNGTAAQRFIVGVE